MVDEDAIFCARPNLLSKIPQRLCPGSLRAGAAAVHFSAKTQHAGTIRVSEQHVEQLRNMLNALTD